MVQSTTELNRLKGVGIVLGKRLHDAGFDSFAKIAEAGEEGLKKVKGMSPRTIGSIVEQSRHLDKEQPGVMQRRVAEVRDKVETLAQKTRDRFGEEMSARCGRKISSDLNRIETALFQMHDFDKKGSKRADKALVKAEKRVTGLEDASLKKVRKGFKRAKKAVLKALR